MKNFNYDKYKNIKLDSETISLITKIYEKKGEQRVYLKQSPDALESLRETARVQSTEASNKIEGIFTTAERMTAILKRKSKPLTRAEEEIAGYRDVLNTIHQNYEFIPFESRYILQLHRDLFKYTAATYTGRYKFTENAIVEKNEKGEIVRVLFEPLKPFETADAIDEVCKQYAKAIDNDIVDPLILIPIVIHDFLCIHPFNDGNGRMSRLLTLFLLYKNGFEVGKYISIEKIIFETKGEYYHALGTADDGWHENNDNPLPFIKYMLMVVYRAYHEFDERFVAINKAIADERAKAKEKGLKATPASELLIKRFIDNHIGKFTKKEVKEHLSMLKEPTIKLALTKLVKEGYVKRIGSGRNSAYVKNNKGEK